MLDGRRQLALVFLANARAARWHDFARRREEFAENFDVLVVNMLNVV